MGRTIVSSQMSYLILLRRTVVALAEGRRVGVGEGEAGGPGGVGASCAQLSVVSPVPVRPVQRTFQSPIFRLGVSEWQARMAEESEGKGGKGLEAGPRRGAGGRLQLSPHSHNLPGGAGRVGSSSHVITHNQPMTNYDYQVLKSSSLFKLYAILLLNFFKGIVPSNWACHLCKIKASSSQVAELKSW